MTRLPMATRPIPPAPRWLTLISQLLAGAGVLGCGLIVLRIVIG